MLLQRLESGISDLGFGIFYGHDVSGYFCTISGDLATSGFLCPTAATLTINNSANYARHGHLSGYLEWLLSSFGLFGRKLFRLWAEYIYDSPAGSQLVGLIWGLLAR